MKAVVSRGEVRALEPLPADWRDGQPLRIEKADDTEMPVEEIDRDFAILADLCSKSDPADEDQLQQALDDAHGQAKEQVRRQMGHGQALKLFLLAFSDFPSQVSPPQIVPAAFDQLHHADAGSHAESELPPLPLAAIAKDLNCLNDARVLD